MSSSLWITPEEAGTAEIVIKKSRFLALLAPVLDADAASQILNEVRAAHPGANHHCYAYTLGTGVPVERFSDDGEPSGTAGRPILEVLRRKSLTNAMIVVTRYFGGTLLGTGGLVHAYSDAAVAAVDATTLLTCQEMHRVAIACDYGLFGKLEYELTKMEYVLFHREFAENVRFSVWSSPDGCDGLVGHLRDWTGGQAEVAVSDAVFVGVRDDGEIVEGVWGQDGLTSTDE